MQAALQQGLHGGVKAAHRAYQHSLAGYHAHRAHVAGVHGAQANHGGVYGFDIARDNALHRGNDVPRYQHRVHRHVGMRTVATLAGDGDGNAVSSGHHGARVDAHHTGRHGRPVVHGIRCVDRKAVKQTVGHHGLGPATAFFGRLKNQHGSTVKIARFCEIPRSAY